jgi:DNA helicase HerA-like ATPase
MNFLSRQPQVVIGSRGPFVAKFDLGLSRYSVPLRKLNTHICVVGRSGKGKSKFLESLLWQLITQGQGCGFIDPHGDSANHLLKLLAFQPIGRERKPWLDDPENVSRLIYCEPGREDYFTPMNVLLSDSDSPYTITTNVVEAFQRTWSKSLEAAPQFKNVTEHALLLLIEHGLTLTELPWVFMDKAFRASLLEKSLQGEIVAFFEQRFDKWGNDQAARVESLLNKVTALTLNPSLKRMLGDDENRLDMRQIMDDGRILIVNLGTCDHETRDLLGSLLTVRLEQAALSRARIEENKRRPFFCVLDEFQKFVANEGSAQVLAQMLSEVRKMGLRLCLAHQGWHQLGNDRLEGALDQAQIKVIFGSGTRTGRVVSEELFVPDPQRVKNEAPTPQSHPYYESLLEQKEMFIQAIRTQKHREIFVLPPEGKQVVVLRTINVPNPNVHTDRLEALKADLLKRSGKTVPVDDAQNSKRHGNPPVKDSRGARRPPWVVR